MRCNSMAGRIDDQIIHQVPVDLSEVQVFLEGVIYPATKREILDVAYDNAAPDHILDFLNLIPDQEYITLTDLIWTLEDLQAK